MKWMIVICSVLMSTAAFAIGMVSFSNNTVPAGGDLLDDSAGFLTPDVPGNKIFAR